MKTTQADEISYEVIRSQRMTADIIIERDGSVLVRAPEWIDDEQVRRIVASKRLWIRQNRAAWRSMNSARIHREYKNGEGFLYLGRSYRLSLVNNQERPLLLRNGRFLLQRNLAVQEQGRQAFQDFYIARGFNRIPRRIAYFAPKIGVEPTGLDVREMGYNWASCSPADKLIFHWKCLLAPQTIIDYLVVHELCHIHHRNHSNAFWNEVAKVLPDYRERKNWLRENGAGLDV